MLVWGSFLALGGGGQLGVSVGVRRSPCRISSHHVMGLVAAYHL